MGVEDYADPSLMHVKGDTFTDLSQNCGPQHHWTQASLKLHRAN